MPVLVEDMNEDSGMEAANYSSCCRLCMMDKVDSLRPIFDDDATESQALVEKIVDFLGIEVSPRY